MGVLNSEKMKRSRESFEFSKKKENCEKEILKEIEMEIQIEDEIRRAMPCSLDDLRTKLIDETHQMIFELNKTLITLKDERDIIHLYAEYLKIKPMDIKDRMSFRGDEKIENEFSSRLRDCTNFHFKRPKLIDGIERDMTTDKLRREDSIKILIQRKNKRLAIINQVIDLKLFSVRSEIMRKVEFLPIEVSEKINEMAFETNVMQYLRKHDYFQVEESKHCYFEKYYETFKYILSFEFFQHVCSNQLLISTKLKKEFLSLYFKQFHMTSFDKLDTDDSEYTKLYGKNFCYFVPFEYGLANSYLIGGEDVKAAKGVKIFKTKIDKFFQTIDTNIQIIESKAYYDKNTLKLIEPTGDSKTFKYERHIYERHLHQYLIFKRKTLVCDLDDVELIKPQDMSLYLRRNKLLFGRPPLDDEGLYSYSQTAFETMHDFIFLNQKPNFSNFYFENYKIGVIIKGTDVPLFGFRVNICNYGRMKTYVYIPIHQEYTFEDLGFKSIRDIDWNKFVFRHVCSRYGVTCNVQTILDLYFKHEQVPYKDIIARLQDD